MNRHSITDLHGCECCTDRKLQSPRSPTRARFLQSCTAEHIHRAAGKKENDSQTCQHIKMSLSARWKMYTWAPRPKNSIISGVKSWPYTICLSILSHLQSGHLQTGSEKKTSKVIMMQRLLLPQAVNCSKNTSTAVMSGKMRLGWPRWKPECVIFDSLPARAHADSPHVKYTSQLSFQRDGWLVCKRIYSRRNWIDSLRGFFFSFAWFSSHPTWCFRSLLLMCIWINRLGCWVEPF